MSSTAAPHEGNTLFPLVLSIVAAAATGVLWAYANPIQLVPGVIQWRIFAFLPPLVGILRETTADDAVECRRRERLQARD